MDKPTPVYVLVTLSLDRQGEVLRRNVGVTFSLHEAEEHASKDVGNEFDTFQIDAQWQEDAAATGLVQAMRGFREIVEDLQKQALQ
jgi:hypothetical protein